MSEFIKSLSKEIRKNEMFEDKNIQLLRFQFFKKSDTLKIVLRSIDPLNSSEEEELKSLILKKLGIDINIEILCYRDVTNCTVKEIGTEHWTSVVEEAARKYPLSRHLLYSAKREIKDNIICVYSGNTTVINHTVNKKVDLEIESRIKDIFNRTVRIEFKYDHNLSIEDEYENRKIEENKQIVKEVMKNRNISSQNTTEKKSNDSNGANAENKQEKKKEFQTYKRAPKDENTVLGGAIKIEATNISEIDERSGYVAVIGEVFKTEVIETKTGKIILTFFITDYTSSIAVKCFLKPQDTEAVLNEVKKSFYCKVRGEAVYDTYSREVVIMGRDINRMKKIEKMDAAPKKRVELHLHTTMSTMDESHLHQN